MEFGVDKGQYLVDIWNRAPVDATVLPFMVRLPPERVKPSKQLYIRVGIGVSFECERIEWMHQA